MVVDSRFGYSLLFNAPASRMNGTEAKEFLQSFSKFSSGVRPGPIAIAE